MSWGTDIIYLEGERGKKRGLKAILDWLEEGVAKFLYRILGGLAS